MKNKLPITILTLIIALLATVASINGIFTSGGPGEYPYKSIRGHEVTIYGQGLYQHMSADVAIQGIAQDYVTLFICVPLLLVSLVLARKGSLRGRFLLAGVLNYFLLTYLFYLNMAMYNSMFLGYVILLGSSFFALVLTIISFDIQNLPAAFVPKPMLKFTGYYLIFMSLSIAMLWLGVVVPPLLDSTIIPVAVEHYTTLVVQGFDLALFLPIAFLSGLLLLQKKPYGYLMAPVTITFLPLLMLALVAKIVAMAMHHVNVIPVIFIIPTFTLVALVCQVFVYRSIKER